MQLSLIHIFFITNAKEAYGPIFYYNTYLDLGDQATFNTFVDEITSRSYYSSNVDVQFGDKFLMLSTCSYEFGPVSDDAHVRTVVVGRRVRDGEKADGSDITYSVNQNVKLPAGFAGGQATAEAVKNAKTESAAGLVPELPGASAAASAGASGAAGGSSAAASPSSSQSAAQTEYDDRALGYADDAQYALKKAREARDEAQNYLDRAERGSAGASEARGAADKAAQAMDRAKQAYYDALDASDLAREIYEKHPSGVTKQAYHCLLYTSAGFLRQRGVDTLICGGIGGGARTALAEAGITLYPGASGEADAQVAALLAGSLSYDPDTVCAHHEGHGEGHDCGSHSCGH